MIDEMGKGETNHLPCLAGSVRTPSRGFDEIVNIV
jgi:hypothetical protein